MNPGKVKDHPIGSVDHLLRLSAAACSFTEMWVEQTVQKAGWMHSKQTLGGKRRCLSGPLRQVDGDCTRCRSGFWGCSCRSGKDASQQLLLWLLHISLLALWGLHPRHAAFGSRRGRLSDILQRAPRREHNKCWVPIHTRYRLTFVQISKANILECFCVCQGFPCACFRIKAEDTCLLPSACPSAAAVLSAAAFAAVTLAALLSAANFLALS